MKWEKKELGDIINLKRGYDLPSRKRISGTVPIISSSGITDFHSEPVHSGEGVVTGRYGTLGKLFYINGDYWPLNTTLYVQDFKGNVPKFIYYFLQTLDLQSFNSASAVPGLDRNVLHKVNVDFITSLPTQRRIADILSAYDDLIENNLKRIQLLEEKAFLRYREIKSENKFRSKTFAEVAEYINGFAFKPKHWKDVGMPIVKIRELKGGIQDSTPRNDGEDIPEKYLISDKDILFAWSASIGAHMWFLGESLLNQHIFNVKPFDEEMHNWLYFSLIEKIPDFKNLSNGSTMQHIKKSALGMVSLSVPEKSVYQKFQEETNPIFDLIVNLHQQNTKLREARDILLPKLMSGQIAV